MPHIYRTKATIMCLERGQDVFLFHFSALRLSASPLLRSRRAPLTCCYRLSVCRSLFAAFACGRRGVAAVQFPRCVRRAGLFTSFAVSHVSNGDRLYPLHLDFRSTCGAVCATVFGCLCAHSSPIPRRKILLQPHRTRPIENSIELFSIKANKIQPIVSVTVSYFSEHNQFNTNHLKT